MTPLDIHPDVKDVLARVRDHIASPVEVSADPRAGSGIDRVS
jgi:hypothetical protein